MTVSAVTTPIFLLADAVDGLHDRRCVSGTKDADQFVR